MLDKFKANILCVNQAAQRRMHAPTPTHAHAGISGKCAAVTKEVPQKYSQLEAVLLTLIRQARVSQYEFSFEIKHAVYCACVLKTGKTDLKIFVLVHTTIVA